MNADIGHSIMDGWNVCRGSLHALSQPGMRRNQVPAWAGICTSRSVPERGPSSSTIISPGGF